MRFENRLEAGRQLAQKLARLKGPKTIVLGIPRGGIVTAEPIAHALNAPFFALVVRKIGAPGNEELALGAIGPNEKPVWNPQIILVVQPDSHWLDEKILEKKQEVRQRKKEFGFADLPTLKGRTIILADDGVATGATFESAVQWLKSQKPTKIVAAVACAPTDTAKRLKRQVDEWVCLQEKSDFYAVGQFYRNFSATSDEQVRDLLACAKSRIEKKQ